MKPAFVFAKPPVAGVSKTRLARGVGPELAADLAAAFLRDTLAQIARIDGLEPVLASTDLGWDFGTAVRRVDQGGGDLGARLERVLRDGIAATGAALAVGADSPGLPDDRLVAALSGLATHDAVFVPSEDGGFVVLAVRTLPEGVLDGIPWSTEHTRSAVVAALVREGLSVAVLEGWFDIDEPVDLERFEREVPLSHAPHTWAVLDRAGRGQSS